MNAPVCPHTGKPTTLAECTTILSTLDDAGRERCRTECPISPKSVEAPRATTENSSQSPKGLPTAWELLMRATGCTTQTALAKKLGTWQAKISQFLVKLSKGIVPAGPVWDKLLELSGLTAAELLDAAMPPAPAPAPHPMMQMQEGETVAEARAKLAAESSAPPLTADPVTSSPSQPSGPASSFPAGPEGPAGQFDPNVGDFVEMPSQAPMVLVGGVHKPLGQALQDVLDRQEVKYGYSGLPEDFAFYTPCSAPPGQRAQLTVTGRGDVTLSAEAVRRYQLQDVRHVRVGYSPSRGLLGIVPAQEQGPGVLALNKGKGSASATVVVRGLFRQYGLDPKRLKASAYPVDQLPGGMLVAAIDPQPMQ